MKISAQVQNKKGHHQVNLTTGDTSQSIIIPSKAVGFGSSVNGGELLFLALATCYCNDIYREAAKRNILVESVEVVVEGDFFAEGEPAKNVVYQVKVTSQAGESEIQALIKHTDTVAEIQNTLRVETAVTLNGIKIESVTKSLG